MNEALRDAIAVAGGRRSLARLLGISHQAIYQWNEIPPKYLIRMEATTGIPRQVLRPDLYAPAEVLEADSLSQALQLISRDKLPSATRRAAARAVHSLMADDPDRLSEPDAITVARRLAGYLMDELQKS